MSVAGVSGRVGDVLKQVVAVAVLAALAWAPAVAAHDGRHGDGRIPGKRDFERIGKEVHRFDSATRSYRVRRRPSEPPMSTHVDPVGADGAHIALPSQEAQPVCSSSGHRIVPVWSRAPGTGSPSDPDAIRSIVRRMNWKLMRESERSSGGKRTVQMLVDCNAQGQIRVHENVSVSGDPDAIRMSVEQGFGTPSGAGSQKYLVFRVGDGPACCSGIAWAWVGSASHPLKSTSDSGNYNRVYTTSAIVWRGTYDAWTTHVTLHELMHALGGTQSSAPFATAGAHCWDGLDSLCYDDLTAPFSYAETRCPVGGFYDTPSGVPIDCGYDTYFDAKPEAGEWLDVYWNVGGPENPFLVPTFDDTIGVYRPSTNGWFLRDDVTGPGNPTWQAAFGVATDLPVAGDWDGDGDDTIGVYRPSTGQWFLRNEVTGPGNPTWTAEFGVSTDKPVWGDWDGDGDDTIGVYRPSTGQWFLRNEVTGPGNPTWTAEFGVSTDKPVWGDWDGDGDDTIGVYRPSTGQWFLRNEVTGPGNPTWTAQFGVSTDLPVYGDWDGH